VARLIEQRGHDAKVLDMLAEITADCPKKQAGNMSDQCAAMTTARPTFRFAAPAFGECENAPYPW
jgi:hypothetical protein